jgi:hypothetical protein
LPGVARRADNPELLLPHWGLQVPRRPGREEKPLYEAIIDAQKLAFGPLSFQAALALRDLGILATLAESGPEGISAERVALLTNLPKYGVEILLESGVACDLIALEDDRFSLRQLGVLVLRDTMTRVNMDFTADVCYRGMAHLREAVKTGQPSGLRELGSWNTIYEGLAQLSPQIRQSWFAFDHYYSDHMFPAALPVVFAEDPPRRLLDVGANTGKFALACFEYDPRVKVELLDLPGQLATAREAITAKGHEARASFHSIDFLDPSQSFPPDQDAIWMSQFLDCFSQDQIV